MNYDAHYNKLIERARTRLLEGYSERHHIIPVCMGGTDGTNNIVRLTAEEHYVAHQLLVKIHPNHAGLVKAATMMSLNANGNRPNNKLYGWLKRKNSKVRSIEMKKNPSKTAFKKGHSPSYKTREKMSVAAKNRTSVHQQKITAALQGKVSPRKGVTLSQETRKKLSDSHMGNISGMKGKKHSQETKRKLRDAWKLRKLRSEDDKNGKTWEEIYGVEGARKRREAANRRAST